MEMDIINVIIHLNTTHKKTVKSDRRLSPKWLTQKSLQIIHKLKSQERSPTYLTLKKNFNYYI